MSRWIFSSGPSRRSGSTASRRAFPASPAGRSAFMARWAVGGAVVPAIGLAAGRGPADLADVAGRPLAWLGARDRARHLGSPPDRAAGRASRCPSRPAVTSSTDRIVGRAVLPDFGEGSFTPTDLGDGAVVTAGVARAAGGGGQRQRVQLRAGPVRSRPAPRGGDRRLRAGHRTFLRQRRSSRHASCTDQRPNGVTDYARIDGTPEVLAGMLAALALAVLGQFVVAVGTPPPP